MAFLANHLFELLAIGWLITAGRDILFWLHFIQLKQYRTDRLLAAFKQPPTWRLVSSVWRLAAFALLIVWELSLRFSDSSRLADALLWTVLAYYSVFALHTLLLAARKRLQLPVLTIKATGLFGLIITIETILLAFYGFWPEQILALSIAQPVIVTIVFLILSLPNKLMQRLLFKRATAYRQTLTGLRVVGITGSYGKTTTKEYLAHLLSHRFKVAKTPAHINVDTGIAAYLLKSVKAEHEIFVVEMGAYKTGEIASSCRIVQPDMAVVTAIANQHLELFGSQDALTSAKFELPDTVTDDRFVANNESPILVEACAKRQRNPQWYGRAGQCLLAPKNLTITETGTTFVIDEVSFKAPIMTTSAVSNLLAAITAAYLLGMDLKAIAQAALTLPAVEHTMQLRKGKSGALLIDATYNANTDGVLSGIADLSLYKKKKSAVVFQDIIELGSDAAADHRRIAKAIAATSDYVMVLPSPFQQEILDEMGKQGMQRQQIFTLDRFADFANICDEDTVVFLAGRGSAKILDRLL